MDETLIEAIEVALASFFSGNNMPDMSGDPRRRLSPLQRRNLTDAARACAPLAYRAGMERAAGIASKHGDWAAERRDDKSCHRDEFSTYRFTGRHLAAHEIAAEIRKEAGEPK